MNDGKPSGGNPPEPAKQDDKMNQQEGAKPRGGLNPEIQARIGHQLRALYDDVVRQGVPDRFAELIRKLDTPGAAEAIRKSDSKEGE
jgi:hypothetical protein